MNKENNYAFIDGANLHCGMDTLGWKLDYKKFRVWITDKFLVTRAYIFLGNIPKFSKLYTYYKNLVIHLFLKKLYMMEMENQKEIVTLILY